MGLEAAPTRGHIRRLKLLWLVLAAGVAFPAAVTSASAAFPGRNGAIVFASIRANGGWELYSVRAGGGAARQLTAHSPEAYGMPAWSPDGNTIAFTRDSGAVFLADAKTGRLRGTPIVGATSDARRSVVSWAPDGTRFAYTSWDTQGGTTVWIADASGAHRRRLTSGPGIAQAAWSPDGTTIAFVRAFGIFVMRPDGTHLRRLTTGSDPVWSPDGTMIAFRSATESVDVIGQSGTGARHLGNGQYPAWSPDSRSVVVAALSNYLRVLTVLAVDGSSSRTLTSGSCEDFGAVWAPSPTIVAEVSCPTNDRGLQAVDPVSGDRRWLAREAESPSWSPDATKLAFIRGRGLLEVANADGSGAHQLLVPPSGSETHPAWSPDGHRLAVEANNPNPLAGAPPLVASPVRLPAWSPDGKHLVGNAADQNQEVVIVDVQTGGLRSIYYADRLYSVLEGAAWSPDGRLIAFGNDNGIVFLTTSGKVINPAFPLPSIQTAERHPSWSPDGKRLAFDRGEFCDEPARDCAIFVQALNGTPGRRIATNASEPAWSPDGRQIAFVRLLGRGNTEIYVMRADGTDQHRLTYNPGPDVNPDWQPTH